MSTLVRGRHYPEDRYHGETGETTAWLHRPGGPPDTQTRSGVTCEHLATGEQTEGRFGLYRWSFGPGDFIYVPEGGIHGFRGGDFAQMLLMFSPGAPREEYFETLARGEPMDPEERAAFMLRHDTYWV